ncbi:YoaK family protein [Hansschlegelia sp. KR7-227]|uniref:YoaK family protein n=1 Tax=Hansschlegelia sp. KR7-227 TaxID=3400914 RepID=UPI003C057851
MKAVLIILLSLTAGYVDAAGFLALHGLFTTHVTGNFVTLGGAIAFGTTGALAKLLALPLFCVVILAARLVGIALDRRGWPALRIMFALQAALLSLGAGFAAKFGPFPDGDAWPALATGGALVSAMAIQNAIHRVRLTSLPPSTVMTGATTQAMVDIADLMRGIGPEKRAAAKKRLGPALISIAAFAVGCGAGALAYTMFRDLCFVAAPVTVIAALVVEATSKSATAQPATA